MRVAIIDGEDVARRRIRHLLGDEPDVDVVGEAGSGTEARELVCRARPDLVFLDVRMHGMNGFDLLHSLPDDARPMVVFVTAQDEHAVRAFAMNAVDYLLKPYDNARFRESLKRAREQMHRREHNHAVMSVECLLRKLRPKDDYLQRVAVRVGEKILILEMADVDWFESAGNYVRVHAGAECYLVRTTLVRLEASLDPRLFVRIHRTAIVHAEAIREVRHWYHGDLAVVLKDGTRLAVGRSCRHRLEGLFQPDES